jgi:hypothetical protein
VNVLLLGAICRITIPALAEEIDGSPFVDCPLIAIHVAPESVNFKTEEYLPHI